MTFDTVVGNPPYNNDMYIDFAFKSHEICKDSVCMITPAKWQAKAGIKNEQFRKYICPYMSDIVYIRKCTDVFCNVSMGEGAITYYNICKEKQSIVNINGIAYDDWIPDFGLDNVYIGIVKRLKCNFINGSEDDSLKPTRGYFTGTRYDRVKANDIYNEDELEAESNVELASNFEHDFEIDDASTYILYDSKRSINVNKNCFRHHKDMNKYKVYVSHYINELSILRLIEPNICANDLYIMLGFGDLDKCESIRSYYKCKLIWFLVYMTNCGANCINSYRYVPDPVVFDHIFTDQELYKKYGITDEEIEYIEKVMS